MNLVFCAPAQLCAQVPADEFAPMPVGDNGTLEDERLSDGPLPSIAWER